MAQAYANEEIAIIPSASYAVTKVTTDQINVDGVSALIVVIDSTVVGTATLTLTIDGKDKASGKYYNLLTGAAISTNATTRYKLSPYLASVANVTANDLVPVIFRITVTQGGTGNATYSCGYTLLRG